MTSTTTSASRVDALALVNHLKPLTDQQAANYCDDVATAALLSLYSGVQALLSDNTCAGLHDACDAALDLMVFSLAKRRHDHTSDEQCIVDSETNCCKLCGVEHGDPCVTCKGRGFHTARCQTEMKIEQLKALNVCGAPRELTQIERQILIEWEVYQAMLSDSDSSDHEEVREIGEKQIDALFECLEKGHDFSGEGYQAVASTETASDDFNCNRCGFSHDVTYY